MPILASSTLDTTSIRHIIVGTSGYTYSVLRFIHFFFFFFILSFFLYKLLRFSNIMNVHFVRLALMVFLKRKHHLQTYCFLIYNNNTRRYHCVCFGSSRPVEPSSSVSTFLFWRRDQSPLDNGYCNIIHYAHTNVVCTYIGLHESIINTSQLEIIGICTYLRRRCRSIKR